MCVCVRGCVRACVCGVCVCVFESTTVCVQALQFYPDLLLTLLIKRWLDVYI